MRHRIVQCSCAYNNTTTTERHGEAIQAPGSRPIQVLAIDIIVRTMAGTLEADAVIAEWDSAAQMHASLIERYPEAAIRILDETLGGQLDSKTRTAQQQGTTSGQMRDIRFSVLYVQYNTRP